MVRMVNLRASLEGAAGSETILSAVIGSFNGYEERIQPDRIPAEKRGVVLPWVEARALLDYEYNNGFGGADCHPVFAWTPTRVLFVHEYDGATGVQWVPREPIALIPLFGGQGLSRPGPGIRRARGVPCR